MTVRSAFLCSLWLAGGLISSGSVFAQSVSVHVSLSPAGNFKAITRQVRGSAYKTADGVRAENVVIDLNSLKTSISLRDKHMKERLMTSQYPEAKLIKAIGRNGKGKALIEIKGVKQEVAGTYEVKGDALSAKFKLSLPTLDIRDIRYMGVGVRDEVEVDITLPLLDRAPASEK